jgi:glutamate 5-kinase
MANSGQYVVVHPIRHDGHFHPRGSVVKLGAKEALRLQDKGAVKDADVVVVVSAPAVALGSSTLAKLNLAELAEYAAAHKFDIKPGLSKDELIAEIGQAALAAAQYAEAEAIASEQNS